MINIEKYGHLIVPVLQRYQINTALRISHFLGQIDHESNGFNTLVENFNYSVESLLVKFSRSRISQSDCEKYGRKTGRPANKQMIANIVYGGAWGHKNLGNITFGDGWKYRGRGPIQCTGLSNYKAFKKATGLDAVANPDLLLDLSIGLEFAGWFWNQKALNHHADNNNTIMVTKIINGGKNGLEERIKLVKKYKAISEALVNKLNAPL